MWEVQSSGTTWRFHDRMPGSDGWMEQICDEKGCKLESLILPAAPVEPRRSSSSRRRVIKTTVSHFPNLEHSIGPIYATIIISYNLHNKIEFLYLKYYFLWPKPPKTTWRSIYIFEYVNRVNRDTLWTVKTLHKNRRVFNSFSVLHKLHYFAYSSSFSVNTHYMGYINVTWKYNFGSNYILLNKWQEMNIDVITDEKVFLRKMSKMFQNIDYMMRNCPRVIIY